MNEKNSEGYRDPTAARAIRNVEREEERKLFKRVPKFVYESVKALNRRFHRSVFELTFVQVYDLSNGKIYTWEDGGWR